MKAMIFIQELLSVVLTPLVLWFSLPDCAPAIIDFFREFTIYVDGLGYVCSFAVFDFKRHGNVNVGISSHKTRASPDRRILYSLAPQLIKPTNDFNRKTAKWRNLSLPSKPPIQSGIRQIQRGLCTCLG